MDSSISLKDEIWFLCVCHHISNAVYTSRIFFCQQIYCISFSLWLAILCVTAILGAFEYASKGAHLVRRSCPFVRLSACISAVPTGPISWNLIFATLRKYAEELQIWLQSDKCIGHYTRRPEYVCAVDSSGRCSVPLQQRKESPILTFPWQLSTVLHCWQLPAVQQQYKGMHYCVSIATVFTRVRHLVRYTSIACPFVYGVWFVIHAVGIKRILFWCNSFEVNLFWEADSSWASEAIPRILLTPKFLDRVYMSPQFVPIMSQLHAVYVTPCCFLRNHCNILLSAPWSSKSFFASRIFSQAFFAAIDV